jgi:predicted component of type VI protein secretion system
MLPLVVHIEGRESGTRSRVFHESPVRIGRSPFASLRLRDPFVSEWQAVVRFHEERTTFLDLGSRNPTRIDGRAIERNVEVAINEQSVVCIGTLRLRFQRRADVPALRDPVSEDETAFAPDQLLEPERPTGTLQLPVAPIAANPVQALARSQAGPLARTLVGVPQRPASPPPPALPRRHDVTNQGTPDDQLLAAHRDYRRAAAEFLSLVRRQVELGPPSSRSNRVLALRRRFPELIHEAAFRDCAQSAGVQAVQLGHLDVEEWLGRLCGRPTTLSAEQAALAMERVGQLLEIFAAAFIESRRAHRRARRKLALDHEAPSQTALAQSEDPHALLAYLLSNHGDAPKRSRELRRALADFAMHQIALLSAVVEGARAMLEQLGPEALHELDQSPHGAASTSTADEDRWTKLWPFPARRLWRSFVVRHRDLTQTDHFARALFGREFTRRYHAIADNAATVHGSPSAARPVHRP